jgi:hypothetical protein
MLPGMAGVSRRSAPAWLGEPGRGGGEGEHTYVAIPGKGVWRRGDIRIGGQDHSPDVTGVICVFRIQIGCKYKMNI